MSEHEFLNEASPNIWARLKQEREAKGLSLGEVSAYLKLTTRQLEAIERGDLSSLPGKAFARGFVRNYARFLHLDPGLFMQAIEVSPEDEVGGLATKMNPQGLGDMPLKRKRRLSFTPIMFIVPGLLALLSAGAYFGWFESRDEDLLASLLPAAAESSPSPAAEASAVVGQSSAAAQSGSVPEMAASAPVQSAAFAPASAQASAPVQSAPQAVQSEAASSLVMVFDDESWVSVRSGDKELVKKLNHKGDTENVEVSPPVTLVIGNASKVKLSWRGKPVELAPHANKSDVARLSLQ